MCCGRKAPFVVRSVREFIWRQIARRDATQVHRSEQTQVLLVLERYANMRTQDAHI